MPRLVMLLLLTVPGGVGMTNEMPDSRTVLGPGNVLLADGANALLAGDAEAGVRLTLAGLELPATDRDRRAAWSNLCAGYVMLDQLDDALPWCNRAVAAGGSWRAYSNRALLHVRAGRYDAAAADIAQADELVAERPRKLREVNALLLDKTHPVRPRIIVDDRRNRGDDGMQ